MKQIELIIAGAGGRGAGYATFAAEHPDRAKVVGVAEPRDHYRTTMAAEHGIDDANVFTDWKDMAAREKFADAVLAPIPQHPHGSEASRF